MPAPGQYEIATQAQRKGYKANKMGGGKAPSASEIVSVCKEGGISGKGGSSSCVKSTWFTGSMFWFSMPSMANWDLDMVKVIHGHL